MDDLGKASLTKEADTEQNKRHLFLLVDVRMCYKGGNKSVTAGIRRQGISEDKIALINCAIQHSYFKTENSNN